MGKRKCAERDRFRERQKRAQADYRWLFAAKRPQYPSFSKLKETDEWGVKPNDNFEVKMSDREFASYIDYRQTGLSASKTEFRKNGL